MLPWFEGTTADLEPPGRGQGAVLGGFFKALHQPAPADAPRNPYRGVPLADREARAVEQLARLAERGDLVTPALRTIWETALATPIDVEPRWMMGDPHARNVLVKDGRLAAMIDWGDMGQGDPANDLGAVWMLLGERAERAAAMAAYGGTAATWARARGWAVAFGAMLADITDDPRLVAMGERTLRRVVAD